MNSSRAFVPFPADLQPVRVVRRLNRFAVEVRWDPEATPPSGSTARLDGTFKLHLPNSGRMTELLQPGTLGLAHLWGRGDRATVGALLLVEYEGRWVSVDAHMPNRLFARCVEVGALPPFRGYKVQKKEVSWAQGRVDFLLAPERPGEDGGVSTASVGVEGQSPSRKCSQRRGTLEKRGFEAGGSKDDARGGPGGDLSKLLFLVETKSCNLVEQGVALFPDAPTARGARHLRELAEAVEMGYRAAVVWFIQRDDAYAFAPHVKADPEFAEALKEARAKGVEAYAYRCLVEPRGVTVLDEVGVGG